MARKVQRRRIAAYPEHWQFTTAGEAGDSEEILLRLDEFEAIRLLDLEGLTQEECAGRMGVSRPTVTAIYESARRKLAELLVLGKPLRISGGSYFIDVGAEAVSRKGRNSMRIAVTYENGQIFQHFGHTAEFKLYDVADGKIVSSQLVPTNGSGHGALAGFLKAAQADALICGGIGMGAQMALSEAGITLYGGVSGSADAAAQALAEGRLEYNPEARCDHHDHGEEHNCGHHNGEEHNCGHQSGGCGGHCHG
ncbi:MAG: DUF134 domain-containing protein [Oscillospiraceae bacterium]|nr:DUF134 domain-containing protein [Oscillospiraceae bacterium]